MESCTYNMNRTKIFRSKLEKLLETYAKTSLKNEKVEKNIMIFIFLTFSLFFFKKWTIPNRNLVTYLMEMSNLTWIICKNNLRAAWVWERCPSHPVHQHLRQVEDLALRSYEWESCLEPPTSCSTREGRTCTWAAQETQPCWRRYGWTSPLWVWEISFHYLSVIWWHGLERDALPHPPIP